MLTHKLFRRLLCLGLVYSALAIAHPIHAQATLTASKGADIFAFGGYTYTVPDYGPDNIHNNGVTLGADYTRYFGWHIQPSVELRYTNATGPIVKESTISGGLRGHFNLGASRYHPYIDVLAGLGTITYVQPPIPNYPPDHGFVLAYGGGIDIDLIHNIMFKADFQIQNWNLGTNLVTVPSGANYTLSPTATTIGVAYHIPFRSRVGSRYSRIEQLPPDRPAPAPKSAPAQSTPPPSSPADTPSTPQPDPTAQPDQPAGQSTAQPAAQPVAQPSTPLSDQPTATTPPDQTPAPPAKPSPNDPAPQTTPPPSTNP